MDGELREGMLPRILRDITDGVLVLDQGGTVRYINPRGCQILGLTKECVGQKYYAVAMDDEKDDNDGFHQFLLDAVYDKDNVHRGELEYTCEDGKKLNLQIVTSFLRNSDGTRKDGVVIQFSDITEVVRLRRKERDTTTVFAVTMILLCSWIFFIQIWEFLGRPVKQQPIRLTAILRKNSARCLKLRMKMKLTYGSENSVSGKKGRI